MKPKSEKALACERLAPALRSAGVPGKDIGRYCQMLGAICGEPETVLAAALTARGAENPVAYAVGVLRRKGGPGDDMRAEAKRLIQSAVVAPPSDLDAALEQVGRDAG